MRFVIVTAAFAVAAGAAQAQQASSPPQQDTTAIIRQHLADTRNRQATSVSTRLYQERLDRRAIDYNPRREGRAERVAALANGGDCQGAYNLAIAEHDQSMARRVVDLCAAQGAVVVTL